MPKTLGIKWEDVEDLGQVPDRVIAERLGCGITAVYDARLKRGIPGARRKIDWEKVEDLGKTWDAKIARRLGTSHSVVAAARRKRGIPRYIGVIKCICCGKSYTTISYNTMVCSTPCLNALEAARSALGRERAGDSDLAILAAYAYTLIKRKELLGFGSTASIDWDSIGVLGELHDTEISELLGCGTNTVRKMRDERGIPAVRRRLRIDWDRITEFGKVSDKTLAERLGCSTATVCKERRKRRIPGIPQTSRIDWDQVTEFGKISDQTLATRLGYSLTQVYKERIKRGIDSWQKTNQHNACKMNNEGENNGSQENQ